MEGHCGATFSAGELQEAISHPIWANVVRESIPQYTWGRHRGVLGENQRIRGKPTSGRCKQEGSLLGRYAWYRSYRYAMVSGEREERDPTKNG